MRLGASYAGVWFDNVTGRFRIAVASRGGRQQSAADEARQIATEAGAGSDTDVIAVTFGWDELAAAQAKLLAQLARPLTDGLLTSSIDIERNRVEVVVSPSADGNVAAAVKQAIAGSDVTASSRTGTPEEFDVAATACSFPNCDRPLRGGVRLRNPPNAGGAGCSAGYLAIHNTTGRRYMLTAGHCTTAGVWGAYHTSSNAYRTIGSIDHSVWDIGGDYARIDATGSFWDTSPWAPLSAFWGINENYPTKYTGWSYPGLFGCRTGGFSFSTCGTVQQSGMVVTYNGVTVGGLFQVNVCAVPGDSGGPFMLDYYAVGIANAASTSCPTSGVSYYSEVMNAQVRMNAQLVRTP